MLVEIDQNDLFPRQCAKCERGMREGYIIDGCTPFCSAVCAFDTPEEKDAFEADYDPEGDSFWTEWDEFDTGQAWTAEGTLVEFEPESMPRCQECFAPLECDGGDGVEAEEWRCKALACRTLHTVPIEIVRTWSNLEVVK